MERMIKKLSVVKNLFFIFKFPLVDVENPQQRANYQAHHILDLNPQLQMTASCCNVGDRATVVFQSACRNLLSRAAHFY